MTRRSSVLWILLLMIAVAGTAIFVRRMPPQTSAPATTSIYQCPMHPQIVSHEPGICPICQMPLQRVDESASAERKPPTPSEVPGHAPFALSVERQQLIGVTRARVEARDLAVTIRAVGRVAYDPELYQAIVEYREALGARGELKDSPWHEARHGADAIVRAAALRLRQRGIAEDQLGLIARSGDPVNLLLPGKSVWVYAQVYEYEVELVRPGESVEVTARSMPGKTYAGKVITVDSILDAATRTVRVRILVPTPDASLRPETFVHARLEAPLGRHLAVPESAVLDTGEHRIVFVVKDGERFEPRSVELGRQAEEYFEVLSGLAEGEEVVTSANFLIDSESRFRAAVAAFVPGGGHVH